MQLQQLSGEWRGTFRQYSNGIDGEYVIVLRIDRVDEEVRTLYGELQWPTLCSACPAIIGSASEYEILWQEALPPQRGEIGVAEYDANGKKIRGGRYIYGGVYKAYLLPSGEMIGQWLDPKQAGRDGGYFRLTRVESA
jgi:hypothetical protein